MTQLDTALRLEDPDFYLEDADEVFARLRATDPVHYYEPLDTFVLTSYEHVRLVGRKPLIFSNEDGILLNDFRYGNVVAAFFPPNAENFALDSPPRHNDLRRLMIPAFSAKNIADMESVIQQYVEQQLDQVTPGEPVNWSTLMAEPLPLTVIALLLGMPLEDVDLLHEWSDIVIRMGDSVDGEEIAKIAGSLAPMGAYFEERLAERRVEPTEDLIGTLETARAAGEISNETVHMILTGVMTAGNETTRNVIAGAVVALAEHPDQFTKLANGASVEMAIEEFIRWVSPVRGFGRTVREDTELGGVPIKAGQRVYMVYGAVNRDPEVFPDPHRFDVERMMTKPQLAFGFGQHACIGAALARMELRILFTEVAKRFSKVSVVSQRRMPSTLANGWADLHVIFE